MRFGDQHLQYIYQSQLDGRRLQSAETLQQFKSDVAKFARAIYYLAPSHFLEHLATQTILKVLVCAL